MKKTKLMLGDNITSLRKLPDNSVDSIVTDPPYGLSFMGKKWDYDVPSVEFWKEVWRVLKPGGHVLSFGGTRTYHRMTVNIEDAGFEIRDQIMWLYGSGFPKSHNIGKAVDRLQGNDREVVGVSNNINFDNKKEGDKSFYDNAWASSDISRKDINITKGNSPWEGWGTAMKPSVEPICVARKPLSEKSVALNVLKWGTGGINIDGSRVGSEVRNNGSSLRNINGNGYDAQISSTRERIQREDSIVEGRFPANIILECLCDEVIKGEKGEVKKSNRRFEILQNKSDGKVERTEDYGDKGDIHTNPMCPCYLMDEQSGVSKSNCKSGVVEGKEAGQMYHRHEQPNNNYKKKVMVGDYSDKGGASRFFYQAKVSKAERNMGLDGFEVEINIGTIKLLIYKRKDEIIWEKQDQNQTHQMDMEPSMKKDIEEYITMEDYVWNTELFGSYIMEKFQKDFKSIIEMKTNSITIYQTLCSWTHLIIKEYIVTQLKEKMVGIKYVENVEKNNTKIYITNQKKDGLNQNVKDVLLKEVLSIKKIKEEIKSSHPTMKPVALMSYLVRLVTPPNGICLDPFMGSGSTGIAAQLEGFRFVGMEMDPDYFKIAEARIENFESYRKFIK
jgi:DNA modification methylase